ncbi:MAG: dihydrolipoyl dehydrogenase [Anaerolineae bacterium]
MAEASSAYDVVIIGGGPGGYVAAIRAAQLGQKVALVEREALGGICLNWGCIPTKSLLRNAEVVQLLQQGKEFGFSFENLTLDYARAIQRSREVSARLVRGVQFLMKKNAIDVFSGTGRLVDPHQVKVEPDGQVLTGKHIIIATGARSRTIPGVAIDGERVITSREALERTEVPQHLIVVGAGPIGLEFADIYHSYGAEVTIVEMLPRVAPLEDEDVSKALARALQRRGIKTMTGARVEKVVRDGDTVQVTVSRDDGQETITGDLVLVAIGVQPNVEGLGLEEVGVRLERGAIAINGYMQTNIPHIYAIGDVTGKMPLAHVASAQGIVAAEHIAGKDPEPIEDYTWMPRCIYCHPQVASLGLTEAQAREQGLEVRVGQFPFQANGKALGLGEREGFVKLVVDAKYGELLGAHMIGPDVTELLPELALARTWELTVEEIARSVHAHPTLAEAVMEAAHAALGQAIHA